MIKTIVRILGGLLSVFLVAVVTVFLLHVPISLGLLFGPASTLLSALTGSRQVIEGHCFLVPGAWTTLSVEDGSLLLTGKKKFRLNAEINSAQTRVHLWSLFTCELNLDGLAVHGVTFDLLTAGKKEESADHKEEGDKPQTEGMPFRLGQTGAIDLTDINATITLGETKERVTLQLEKGRGALSRNAPGKLEIKAMLNGRQLRAELEGGPLAELATFDTDWPFSIHVSHKSVAAAITGAIAKEATEQQVAADLSLSGEHFDDLVSIFGLHGSKNKSFALQGSTRLSREEIRADFEKVQAGEEILALSTFAKNLGSQDSQYGFVLRSERLNLDELKEFFAGEKKKSGGSARKTKKAKISRDDILIPDTFPLKNLSLDLDIKELVIAAEKIKDVRLNVVMDNGRIVQSPVAVTFKNVPFNGCFSFDRDDNIPKFSAHLDSVFFNVGGFLQDCQLADNFVMSLNKVKTDINTRGKTLGELFDNLVFRLHAEDGNYEYIDANTGAVLPIVLNNTEISGVPGEKIALTTEGFIADNPVSIVVEIDDRRDEPPKSVKEVSVTLHSQLADTQLDFSGNIPLPFRKEGIVLTGKMAGERLSNLNGLLQVQLPDLGPYEVNGTFKIVEEGYRLDGIQVRVGSSTMKGDCSVDTKAVPPGVRLGLEAQRIQLDDFQAILPQPQEASVGEQKAKDEKDGGPEEKGKFPTDQAVLDSYNASIAIEVNEVLSGTDYLGSGTLKMEQQQGKFQISPLHLRLPDGNVTINFSMSPTGNDRFYTLNIDVEGLEYGVMARMFKPGTDMSGIINVRTFLESKSPDAQSIMANSSGYLDFSLQPQQIRAGVIDLWSVNLLSYLFPMLTSGSTSKINCVAGRFNIKDGLLSQDGFLIDTSQVQVKGVVKVDFDKRVIDATLRPIPKRPQFYSLSTPIKIHGSFSQLEARITPGGVIGTVIRLATSYIVVPLQWIIQNKLPEDGTAACLQLVEERTP
ncbi:MAG: AsmA-like C-terminal region-containing protein [Proteobacteria bacterium]|nr:AsmA-like C-terminal region-containing protein [Pseudomonadota bacterium]